MSWYPFVPLVLFFVSLATMSFGANLYSKLYYRYDRNGPVPIQLRLVLILVLVSETMAIFSALGIVLGPVLIGTHQ